MDSEMVWDWVEGGGPMDGCKYGDGFIEEDVEGEIVRHDWVTKKCT